MPLSEREELELLELEAREKSFPAQPTPAPKQENPSMLESVKSGFLEKKLPAGASGWDKFVAYVGEEAPSIAGGTVGAIKGAAIGTALGGPVGGVVGGIAGGAMGAGSARLGQEVVQKMAGTNESDSDSLSDIGKSMAEGAAGEMLGPGIKLLGRAASKTLGWTSGLGINSISKILEKPEIVLSKIGKITKYDVDDAAKAAINKMNDLGLDAKFKKELTSVLKDPNPADAFSHIIKKEGELFVDPAVSLSREVLEDFTEKKIAYDATRLLNTAGIMDISSSPSAMLAAMGLLNMSLGTGLAGVAIKSPAIAGAGTAAATGATKFVTKKLGKEGAALAGQTIAHSVEDDTKE